MATRRETDSLGPVDVPADRYWGAQTARALAGYGADQGRFPSAFIRALGLVKACAAEALVATGGLDARRGDLIRRAADEVAAGDLDDHFPLGPWQSGSGTQTHMNANEVIAGRANELAGAGRGGREPVHPNDHVNRGQSTNDVFPTAMHVALLAGTAGRLLPALDTLAAALRGRAEAWAPLIKTGRTHLMDAVPLTLGQEVSGWAHQVVAARARIAWAAAGLHELALGGTAVGTGLNAPPGYAD
ncbi:MAG: class II fumarate hydratase, partial [Krumholzibacteria bacterium]|nr:class II fumarate hydratase [Candidatus Krumholzibacteria bacterium]